MIIGFIKTLVVICLAGALMFITIGGHGFLNICEDKNNFYDDDLKSRIDVYTFSENNSLSSCFEYCVNMSFKASWPFPGNSCWKEGFCLEACK